MCGIIGILGHTDISTQILNGLKLLEYRGYDSLGIATIHDNKGLSVRKALGKVSNLEQQLEKEPLYGHIGIGHTRWASHGAPTLSNTHPILSQNKKIALVHNGIIENYQELKSELLNNGYIFQTQTDSEVIVGLIERYLQNNITAHNAVQQVVQRLRGIFAIAVIFSDYPELLIGAKNGSNLVIGISQAQGEYYLASDTNALANYCNQAIHLRDKELVVIDRKGYGIFNDLGATVEPVFLPVESSAQAGKGDYPTFMLKEIYEQPRVLAAAFDHYQNFNSYVYGINWKEIRQINIIACGTSLYAGYIAKYWLESIGQSVNLEIASEFRGVCHTDRDDQAFIFISQSGETADTMAALKRVGSYTDNIIGIVNVKNSGIAKAVKYCIETFAGMETAVASTKSFTNQLAALAALAMSISPKLSFDKLSATAGLKRSLTLDDQIKLIVRDILADCSKAIYIGRGCGYPLALEGALKLKELTYIPAIGIAAGELKHGSIALIDGATPVIAIAPSNDPLFLKMVSSIHEVKARSGKIILLSDKQGIEHIGALSDFSLEVQYAHNEFIMPFLYIAPLQLLAHHTAIAKNLDVDRPRNLAKSITVE